MMMVFYRCRKYKIGEKEILVKNWIEKNKIENAHSATAVCSAKLLNKRFKTKMKFEIFFLPNFDPNQSAFLHFQSSWMLFANSYLDAQTKLLSSLKRIFCSIVFTAHIFFSVQTNSPHFCLPGPPKSMNDILKSRQQMHDNSLQMQFFEPASFWRPFPSELEIRSNGTNWKRMTDDQIKCPFMQNANLHFEKSSSIFYNCTPSPVACSTRAHALDV